MYSNLSRDMLNHELPSLSSVSIGSLFGSAPKMFDCMVHTLINVKPNISTKLLIFHVMKIFWGDCKTLIIEN